MENHRSFSPTGHTDKPVVLGRARVAVEGQVTVEGHWEQLKAEDAWRAEFPQDCATLSRSAGSRRMLGVALGIGVLLALVGCTATEGCGECQAPTENWERPQMGHRIPVTSPLLAVAPQDMVSQLLQRLEGSVNFKEPPNPSVLLAMNLAGGDSDGETHKWLLEEIKKEVVEKAHKGREGKEGRHQLLGDQVSASSWGAQP